MLALSEKRPSKIGHSTKSDSRITHIGPRKILKLNEHTPKLENPNLFNLEKFNSLSRITEKVNNVNDKLLLFKQFNRKIKYEKKKKEIYTFCNICEIEFKEINNSLICIKCSREKDLSRHSGIEYSETGSDYNTSDTSFMPFRFTGKDSGRYHKTLLKSSSNYLLYSKNNNIKDLQRYNDQFTGKKVPKFAIVIAIDLFCKIKQYRIFRNNGKRGVIGGCLLQACLSLNIPRTPREISALLNIEEKFLSQGNSIIEEMAESGRIELICKNPLRGYIDQFLESLNIEEKYTDFLVELIEKANIKKITNDRDCRPTTKCAGAIYFLSGRLKIKIDPENISKVCDVTKNTFDKYSKLLFKKGYLFRNTFKKYRIPMDKKWKKIKSDKKNKK